MKLRNVSALGVVAASLMAGAVGCEIIASVDRDQIDKSSTSGGGAGGKSASSSASSSSSGGGVGGAGGAGGAVGVGGAGGAGGTAGVGGAGGTAGVGGAGGTAGVGGAGGTAGVGGAGGAPGACGTPNDCPDPGNECLNRTCIAGACGTAPVAIGTPLAQQTAGDCLTAVCDGNGGTTTANDDADIQNDNNACTDDICSGGASSHTPVANGTSCGPNLTCVGGACTGCATAADCPGVDDECKTRTCTLGVCGFNNTAAGTLVAMQTTGNCQKNQCDGSGNIESVPDNTDVPADDGNQCTDDVCVAGAPAHPAKAIDTACTQGGGSFCSAAGTCVMCNAAAQCAGLDTACHTRTCNANTCGAINPPAGTFVNQGAPGDCQKNECDGAGNIQSAPDNTDVPADDGNQCTSDVCVAGAPAHPAKAIDTPCNQGGGAFCSAAATCVQCNVAAQCAGSDTECHTRTCNANTCGAIDPPAGTPTPSQTPGDCQKSQCDGNGGIQSVPDDLDVPVDDGNQCTNDVCLNGAVIHPAKAIDTPCNQGGGSFCSAAATCVQCNVPAQCAGSDTPCHTKTCNANTCGANDAPAGTVVGNPVVGDCQSNQCDGLGGIVSGVDDTDVPADDGIECTSDVCSGGAPVHPPKAIDTPCSQGGGSFCTAGGSCVQCNVASQCPGSDTECQTRTCGSNTCGVNNAALGTLTASQTPGDCKKNQCDGLGAIQSVNDNADVPIDDGNQCTDDVCSAGVPYVFTAVNAGCNQGGGQACNGAGSCVVRPAVASVSPADGALAPALTSIAVTFTKAMNPASLTGQTVHGACTDTIQVSADNFATCLPFAAAAAVMSGGNTIATLTPAPALSFGTAYKIRVLSAAADASGVVMAADFTTATGFTTLTDVTSGPSVVISQVYGGGGLGSATYQNDFVVLYNRGPVAIDISSMSIQYAATAGTTWSKLNLTGSIPAGGYYLIKLSSAAAIGSLLPTADLTGSIDMAGSNGKVALVNNQTLIASGTSCPLGATVLDFVGYGTANCFEGAAAAAALSSTLSAQRKGQGCQDSDNNQSDFSALLPAPRNSATPPLICAVSVNEKGVGPELDFCNVQFPLSLSVQTGATTPLIFAQAYELGSTEAAGPATNLVAQIGYGPTTANPENQAGWTWTNAVYNGQGGFMNNNDEWMAQFTAPAVGIYRYGSRFSYDGVQWTYCDVNGAGSDPGHVFETAQLPVLTVNP